MAKYNPSFGRLTDEELLRQVRASTVDPLAEELCQRLERFLESAAELKEVSTTRHLCPECDAAILVCIDTQPKPKINLRKAPRL